MAVHHGSVDFSTTNCQPCHAAPWPVWDVGSTAHQTHTVNGSPNMRGTFLSCNYCHDTNHFPYFNAGVDQNGDGLIKLSETTVCNTCHSPNGSYDGVNNSVYGAKANWVNGVYSGSLLAAGKEKWCATCHDEVPSVIRGISAPNTIGDEDGSTSYGVGWGYYKTGHGLSGNNYPATEAPAANIQCTGCHDLTLAHIDGQQRTYAAASNNYKVGYRLKIANNVPRGSQSQDDFALCFSCHNSALYLDQTNYTTNFRSSTVNAHWGHLMNSRPFYDWDSDWDGAADSLISCTACHNIHGSPSPAMLQHGELISTPETTDKVPALGFNYLPSGSNPKLMNSLGGSIKFYGVGPGSVAKNHVCNMCHNDSISYTRTPKNIYP
ncbi:MAG: hypothetical protein HQL31_07895 [Planctomycetes bacterium]|nr:hypothetical protein [Planctomycetota bacterium]